MLLIDMLKYVLCLILLPLLWACGPKAKVETVVQKKPVPPKQIRQIHFFMETSASMAGYLKGATDFVKNVPNIMVDLEGSELSAAKPLKIYYIAGRALPFSGNTQDFIHQLSTAKVASSRTSEMHRIFELIAANTEPNDVSVFISDCILSYPDAEIRQNPEISREKAAGELKALIKSTFRSLKEKGFSASMYGFNSAFYGQYYNYRNEKILLKGTQRPYYLWVIGPKQLVRQINTKLGNLNALKPFIKLDFGAFDRTVTDYQILFGYAKQGSWRIVKNEIQDLNSSAKKLSTIAVALDLKSIPENLTSTGYLFNNLKTTGKNVSFKVRKVLASSEVDRRMLKSMEKKILDGSTHVVLIDILDLYQPAGSLELSLPLRYSDAYKSFSVMDDRNLDSLAGKTFALEHLINGVREAYENPNADFIHISIPVQN